MKRNLLLFLLLYLSELAFCQTQNRTIDSLITVLVTAKEDTHKVKTSYLLVSNLWKAGEFDKAMSYAKDALSLAEKLKFAKGLVASYNYIGTIYREKGNYPMSLQNFLTALKVAEESNNKALIAICYNNIGTVYFSQGNLTESLKNYLASLSIEKELGNKKNIASNYNNIGNIYRMQDNLSEALENHLAALKIEEENNNKSGIADCYGNIAIIYAEQQNYPEALKNFLAALKIKEEINDRYDIAASYINLGQLNMLLDKPIEAKEYLNKGLEESKKVGNRDRIKDSYRGLAELNRRTGNLSKAYEYLQKYGDIKDSILNQESNKQISQLKIQYETDKKDQQIKTQNLQLQNQSLQNGILRTRIYYGIAISLMVIGIIGLLFYLSSLRNRKKKKEYEHMLTDLELTVLKAQLNPHFISNSLSAIKNFIDEQPGKASQFLLKFARLMRRVLEQNEQPLISLKEELETIELYMQIESLRLRYGFDFYFNCDSSIDQDILLVPPLILQPTIENAIWHGLAAKSERGKIVININLENDLLKFNIEDNGAGQESKKDGVSTHLEEKKSFGVSITRKRIEIMSKELKKNGYYNLNFFEGRTITEIAIPVNYS